MAEPLFYVPESSPNEVYQRPDGGQMGFRVCTCAEDVGGAAQEIARALNRLPEAEALLVDIVSAIRQVGGGLTGPAAELTSRANAIEEWMTQ